MKRCIRCGGHGDFKRAVCPTCVERGRHNLVMFKDHMFIDACAQCATPTGHKTRLCERCTRPKRPYSRVGEIQRFDDVVSLTTARIGFRLIRGFAMVGAR